MSLQMPPLQGLGFLATRCYKHNVATRLKRFLKSSLPASPGTLPVESVAASEQRSTLCTFCMDIVQKFQDIADANKTFEDFRDVIVGMCMVALDSTFEKGHVMCPGLVDAYGPVIQYVLSHKVFDPTVLCRDLHVCPSTSVGTRGSKLTREQDDKAFLLRFRDIMMDLRVNAPLKHENMPVVREGDLLGLYSGALPVASSGKQRQRRAGDKIRILQFSDLHLDHLYKEGTATDCGLYMCCRAMWPGKGSAGHYGDYSCDLPPVTLDLFLKEISSLDPPPDIVVYTGDNPPHDIWMESFAGQVEATQSLVEYVRQGLGNTTIYPALGNHESFPQSQYFAPIWEYQNLTRSLSKIWQKWLTLDASQLATVSEGGYYTTGVEGFPGLRILALNTDYGYAANFYTLLNDENPYYAQYQDWIYSTLDAAEKAGEKVLIIGHIPPSDSTARSDFGETFLNISKRYHKTIISFLLGHTHKDQLTLVKDDSGAYESLLIAPSVTPRVDQNPSYRVFEMDPNSFELLDYLQFHMNLTKANELYHQGKEPQWECAYTATSLYNMADISTASWANLAERMSSNSTLVELYHYNRYGQSLSKYKKCDKVCQRDMLCEINNIVSSRVYECLA